MDIDPKYMKPRRLKGTISYKIRNYFAVGVLSFGVVYAAIFHYGGARDSFKKLCDSGFFEPSEDRLKKKASMMYGTPTIDVPTSRLKQMIKDAEDSTPK